MTTSEELSEKESIIRFLEQQNLSLKMVLLDQLAASALSSGRCPPDGCYDWAFTALKEREKCIAALET